MSKERRPLRCLQALYLEDNDWYFRVYVIASKATEVVDEDQLFLNLERHARTIAGKHLSAEFTYIRSGFVIAHYGRRGVTHSFWHWARWGDTWEYFCQAWYGYGRNVDLMAPLDRNEPILCVYEIDIVMREALALQDLAKTSRSNDDILQNYRSLGCIG
jgi:hypothetical protein